MRAVDDIHHQRTVVRRERLVAVAAESLDAVGSIAGGEELEQRVRLVESDHFGLTCRANELLSGE